MQLSLPREGLFMLLKESGIWPQLAEEQFGVLIQPLHQHYDPWKQLGEAKTQVAVGASLQTLLSFLTVTHLSHIVPPIPAGKKCVSKLATQIAFA